MNIIYGNRDSAYYINDEVNYVFINCDDGVFCISNLSGEVQIRKLDDSGIETVNDIVRNDHEITDFPGW